MCGLFFSNILNDDLNFVTPFIKKRGRDEINHLKTEEALFLHSRLAINNYGEVGIQPLVVRNGELTILFNGEIYNFKELTKRYYDGENINDTNLLGRLISDFGVYEAIPKINGMYAIVVFDNATGKVFCARDQFGQKPLFYSFKQGLRISSSLQAIASLTLAAPSESAFKVYSVYGYFPTPYTAYEGILQCEPGTITEFDALAPSRLLETEIHYTSAEVQSRHASLDAADTISLFDKMAERHAYDADDHCLMLSGGIDSTLVSTFMVECGVSRSFSVGFSGHNEFDETSDALKTASVLGLEHSVLEFSRDDYFKQVSALNEIYEQPFGDSSALPTSLLLKELASKGYKVAYGGDGGDELFFGYKRHKKFGDIRAIKSPLRRFFSSTNLLGIKFKSDKFRRLYELSNSETDSSFILQTRNLSRNKIDYSHLHHGAQRKESFSETLKYFDIRSIFSNDLMMKTDRPSMYYGLEVRSPLIDFNINHLSDLLLRSDRYFYRRNKKYLKDIIEMKNQKVPIKVSKKGFSVPVDNWIRKEWRDWASDLISDFCNQRRFEYDYNLTKCIFKEHMENKVNSRDFIWSLLMYQNWIQKL